MDTQEILSHVDHTLLKMCIRDSSGFITDVIGSRQPAAQSNKTSGVSYETVLDNLGDIEFASLGGINNIVVGILLHGQRCDRDISLAVEGLLSYRNDQEEPTIGKLNVGALKGDLGEIRTCLLYTSATGLEALFGYLHLCGEQQRLRALFAAIVQGQNNE